MKLGRRLFTLRTAAGLSQVDLADQLDVSRQSVSKWETDQSVPELDKLLRMSELFGVTLDELVRGEAMTEGSPLPAGSKQDTADAGARDPAGRAVGADTRGAGESQSVCGDAAGVDLPDGSQAAESVGGAGKGTHKIDYISSLGSLKHPAGERHGGSGHRVPHVQKYHGVGLMIAAVLLGAWFMLSVGNEMGLYVFIAFCIPGLMCMLIPRHAVLCCAWYAVFLYLIVYDLESFGWLDPIGLAVYLLRAPTPSPAVIKETLLCLFLYLMIWITLKRLRRRALCPTVGRWILLGACAAGYVGLRLIPPELPVELWGEEPLFLHRMVEAINNVQLALFVITLILAACLLRGVKREKGTAL